MGASFSVLLPQSASNKNAIIYQPQEKTGVDMCELIELSERVDKQCTEYEAGRALLQTRFGNANVEIGGRVSTHTVLNSDPEAIATCLRGKYGAKMDVSVVTLDEYGHRYLSAGIDTQSYHRRNAVECSIK